MPHADSALVPASVTTKTAFWEHVHDQLAALLGGGQCAWVTNLANASSLIYNSLLAFPSHFGDGERRVNWCGFYIDSVLFPRPSLSAVAREPLPNALLLGPFCGKPACQLVYTAPPLARGVCSEAFITRKTLLVPDVEVYPGHIACDGDTRSELVVPLILDGPDGLEKVVGVLDLDCLTLQGFDEDDQRGLERIARLLVNACEW